MLVSTIAVLLIVHFLRTYILFYKEKYFFIEKKQRRNKEERSGN